MAIQHMQLAGETGVAELSMDEIDTVNGGILFVPLFFAVVATSAMVGGVRGTFAGVAKKAAAQAADD